MDKGTKIRYVHPDEHGFGRVAKGVDLTAEMHELDLQHGTEAEVFDHDVDTGWPVIKWVDRVGINRFTTVDPQFFDEHFREVSEQ